MKSVLTCRLQILLFFGCYMQQKKSIKMLVGHLGLSQGAHAGDSTLPVELRPSGALLLCLGFGS